MSTLRRRFLAGAVVPAAALGLLFAAPGLASASTTAAPVVSEPAGDHGHGHHHHGLGLDLSIVLGIHLGLDGGHWHDGGWPGDDWDQCGLLGC